MATLQGTRALGPAEVKLKRGSSGPPRGKINKNQDQEEDRHSARKLVRKRTGGGHKTPREEKGGIFSWLRSSQKVHQSTNEKETPQGQRIASKKIC